MIAADKLALVAVVAGLLAVSGCGGGAEPAADHNWQSCVAAWNSPENEANRAVVIASGGAAWNTAVLRWTGTPDTVDPATDDLTTEGCSYVFFTSDRWLSITGAWAEDGSLRWGTEIERGERRPEQRFTQNATVAADGTIR